MEDLKRMLDENGIPYSNGTWQNCLDAIKVEGSVSVVFTESSSGEVWDAYVGGMEYGRLAIWRVSAQAVLSEYVSIGDFKQLETRRWDLRRVA